MKWNLDSNSSFMTSSGSELSNSDYSANDIEHSKEEGNTWKLWKVLSAKPILFSVVLLLGKVVTFLFIVITGVVISISQSGRVDLSLYKKTKAKQYTNTTWNEDGIVSHFRKYGEKRWGCKIDFSKYGCMDDMDYGGDCGGNCDFEFDRRRSVRRMAKEHERDKWDSYETRRKRKIEEHREEQERSKNKRFSSRSGDFSSKYNYEKKWHRGRFETKEIWLSKNIKP